MFVAIIKADDFFAFAFTDHRCDNARACRVLAVREFVTIAEKEDI